MRDDPLQRKPRGNLDSRSSRLKHTIGITTMAGSASTTPRFARLQLERFLRARGYPDAADRVA
jgi:hypothetical protein